VGEWILNGAHY